MKSQKSVDKLLVEKSINMAARKGDEYNKFRFAQMEGRKLTDAERRNCNVYLFGAMWDHMTVDDLKALP